MFAGASVAMANDTAVNAAAYGPEPLGEFVNEESIIRMESETIDITFGRKESKVHCRFVFRSGKNSGDAVQTLGFPDHEGQDVNPILKMTTTVDGVEVAVKKEKGWFPEDKNSQARLGNPPADIKASITEFHTMVVRFPPDRDVIVEREYTISNGGSVRGDATFYYTTRTGGIWRGSIGRAEFRVTLEGWTVADLAFEDGPQKIQPRAQLSYSSPNRSEWKVVSPTMLKLVWENFEPAVHTTRQHINLTTWIDPKWANP